MALFVITVKLLRNPKHDPHNKVTGDCPVSGRTCTDVTGEHHSYLAAALTAEQAKLAAAETWAHVTRVELVDPSSNDELWMQTER